MNKTLLGKVDHLLCYDCLLFSDSNEYRPRDNTNRQILQGREFVSTHQTDSLLGVSLAQETGHFECS